MHDPEKVQLGSPLLVPEASPRDVLRSLWVGRKQELQLLYDHFNRASCRPAWGPHPNGVERGDAWPVGIGGPARAGVAGGERGLQRIGAVAAQRFGAGQRIEALAD